MTLRSHVANCVLPPAGEVSTALGTLSTTGTSLVDIRGEQLGVQAAAISLRYTGGSLGLPSRTYTLGPGVCTVIAAGLHIRCPTKPGVGANYTFVVTVNGTDSEESARTLSYTPPSVGGVYGPGAALAGTGALFVA